MGSHFGIGTFLVKSGSIVLAKRIHTLVAPADKFLIPKTPTKTAFKKQGFFCTNKSKHLRREVHKERGLHVLGW